MHGSSSLPKQHTITALAEREEDRVREQAWLCVREGMEELELAGLHVVHVHMCNHLGYD